MELFPEHFRREHLLSTIDARIKLLVAMIILAMVISSHGFIFPSCILLFSAVLYVRMNMPIRVFILRFSEPLLIATVLVIIKLFFSGHEILFSFNFVGFQITTFRDGLVEGLAIAVRILAAVSVVTVIGFATTFTEFIAGVSWFKMPRGFTEILMFAYRYIFVLLEEAMVIYNAQKNRLGYSSIRRGLSSFGILAGSLTLKAFEHSHNTTTAMVQRGYDGNVPVLKHKPFNRSEIMLSAILLLVMAVIWKI